MNIISSKLKELIEGYEYSDDPTLTEAEKKDIELHLDLAVTETLELYEIMNKIKYINVSIDWRQD